MLRLLARAKINWSLDILGRRPDGYHLMDMLMGSVYLGDELLIQPSDTLTLSVVGDKTLATDDNLVLKAARALQDSQGCANGAAMTLVKRVPVGAGMGGGSADAAAALVGLNQLWNLHLSDEVLRMIALTLGADVPFLIRGGLARVGGIGETLEQLPALPAVPLVIIQPCQPLSTRSVFSAYDQLSQTGHPQTDAAQEALVRLDFARLTQTAGNVLAAAIDHSRPQIAEAVAALSALDAGFSMMTGSGSAVFGAFNSEQTAAEAYRTLRKRWRRCWLTHAASDGIAHFPE